MPTIPYWLILALSLFGAATQLGQMFSYSEPYQEESYPTDEDPNNIQAP